MYTNLINALDLKKLLSSKKTVILDCRFSLADTNWGRREFKKGHIPTAQYAHLDDDLSGQIIKGETGRHPFPTAEGFAQKCSQWGIDATTQVIAYDQGHGGIAARVWILLKWRITSLILVQKEGVAVERWFARVRLSRWRKRRGVIRGVF